MTQHWSIRSLRILGLAAAAGSTLAADLPDSKINPQSGFIEIADPVWAETNQDLRFVINPGDRTHTEITSLTEHPANDRQPRMVTAPSGDSWVVWWRDEAIHRVVARKRTYATGTWSAERVLSSATESSQAPSVAFDGTRAWVAYEYATCGGRGIAVGVITDEPDPIGVCSPVATTGSTAKLDVQLHAEAGALWVTWIDGPTAVGYSAYHAGSGTWTAPQYEAYAGDGPDGARSRIQDDVIAN